MKKNEYNILQILVKMATDRKRVQYPNVPEEYLIEPQYNDRTANGLTKCIIDFIRFSGGQAERISNTGRVLDGRKKVKDCLGRTRQIGSVEWVPGTGTNGTADVSAIYNGVSIKIEVKIGKDRQSQAQQEYQREVEAAGGIYILARTFADFYEGFEKIQKISPGTDPEA